MFASVGYQALSRSDDILVNARSFNISKMLNLLPNISLPKLSKRLLNKIFVFEIRIVEWHTRDFSLPVAGMMSQLAGDVSKADVLAALHGRDPIVKRYWRLFRQP